MRHEASGQATRPLCCTARAAAGRTVAAARLLPGVPRALTAAPARRPRGCARARARQLERLGAHPRGTHERARRTRRCQGRAPARAPARLQPRWPAASAGRQQCAAWVRRRSAGDPVGGGPGAAGGAVRLGPDPAAARPLRTSGAAGGPRPVRTSRRARTRRDQQLARRARPSAAVRPGRSCWQPICATPRRCCRTSFCSCCSCWPCCRATPPFCPSMRAAAPTQPVPVGAVRAPSCSKSDSLALQHARSAGDWLELLRALVLALEVPHRIILGEPPKRMCLGEAVQAHKPGLSAHLPHPVKMLGAQEARRAMPARSGCSSSPPRATARWSRYGKMRARSSRPLMARWCPSPPVRAPRVAGAAQHAAWQ